jgi:uncharacterized protein (DUF1697 family)
MQKLISFLRGVNMTGHNSIRMADLSELYKNLGFSDAVTFIQSGNVIFSSAGKATSADIAEKIEKGILDSFSYKIPVMIRTLPEMEDLLSSNPFLKEEKFDPAKMAVIFLHEIPLDINIQNIINVDYPPDKFKIIGKEIFIFCPNGFGRTKLYTTFFEKKINVKGTARNWKTITTVFDLANKK